MVRLMAVAIKIADILIGVSFSRLPWTRLPPKSMQFWCQPPSLPSRPGWLAF